MLLVAHAGNSLLSCFQMTRTRGSKEQMRIKASGFGKRRRDVSAPAARKLTAMEWVKGVSARWWGKRQSQKPIGGTRKRSAG
jgi:hypothetical protein